MQKAPLIVALAAICAGGIGIGIAATSNRSAPPVVVAPSSQPSPSIALSPTPPVVASPAPTPAPSPLDDFSHQRLVFRDEVKNSSFAPFRDRARQAIQRRDLEFLKSVVPKGEIALGFGSPRPLKEYLKSEDSIAPLWSIFEKALSGPCSLTNVKSEQDADGFVCSNAAGELEKQYPPPKGTQGIGHLLDKVIIEGENINVRAQPSAKSAIVARLSNEVVKLDRKTFEQQYSATKERYDPIKSWMPIIVPNGKSGFVSSQYAHQPLEYRVIFAKMNGKWQLTEIPGGD